MKALISPNEAALNPNTLQVIGERIAEVNEVEFEVASPLFWVDCASDVVANEFYYDPSSQQIIKIPEVSSTQ
jgi:hypothetical protein